MKRTPKTSAPAKFARYASQANLLALIENTPSGIWSVDRQYRLIIGNSIFQRDTSAALGRAIAPGECVLLDAFPPAVTHQWKNYYDRALRGERFTVEVGTRAKMPPQIIEYRFNPILARNGQVTGVTIFGNDITEHKRAEQSLRAREQDYWSREKEILLKEIHHRVKNNLNVVSGLLELQTALIADAPTRALFEPSQKRIRAMALVHEKMYQSSDLARVNIADYIQDVVASLRVASARTATAQVIVQADAVALDLDTAIACGMLINELVTNAFKYAFPPEAARAETAGNEICVALKCRDDQITLTVRDNGIGLPRALDWRHPPSLGLQLAQMFAEQLTATFELDPTAGTAWCITFALPRAQEEDRNEQ